MYTVYTVYLKFIPNTGISYLKLEQRHNGMGIRPCQSPVGSLNVGEEVKEEFGGILLSVRAELCMTSADHRLEHDGPNSILSLVRERGTVTHSHRDPPMTTPTFTHIHIHVYTHSLKMQPIHSLSCAHKLTNTHLRFLLYFIILCWWLCWLIFWVASRQETHWQLTPAHTRAHTHTHTHTHCDSPALDLTSACWSHY